MIVWTVGRKKDKTSPNCPRQTGPRLNAGNIIHVWCVTRVNETAKDVLQSTIFWLQKKKEKKRWCVESRECHLICQNYNYGGGEAVVWADINHGTIVSTDTCSS